jgi:hypothetical protein
VNRTALPRPDGFAEPLSGRRARCKACQRRCLLEEGQLGYCGVRTNQGSKLRPLAYGRVAAMHLANVERKPLYHFFPGNIMLSPGSLGCKYRCQNPIAGPVRLVARVDLKDLHGEGNHQVMKTWLYPQAAFSPILFPQQ